MTPDPWFSIVIPTCRRRAQLIRCLNSILAQTLPRECWEVIVVIDGDDPPLDEELSAFAFRLPLRFHRQPNAGCGIARNTGASLALGRYLVFTDDDCLFPADWLSRYAEALAHDPDCVIAGRSINALPGNFYSQATQDLIDYLFTHFNARRNDATLAVGNNFSVPAGGFRALGGFSPLFFRMAAEDRDFCARWRAQGGRIIFAPSVVVEHAHRLTLLSYFQQHFHYGRGAWLLHRLDTRRLESPGFYVSLLLWPWTHLPAGRAALMSILFVYAQAAHTLGYLWGLMAGAKSGPSP